MVTKNFKVVLEDGSSFISTLLVGDESPYSVQLKFDTYDSGIIVNKTIYHAMKDLQLLLDQSNIKLLCNAFRLDMRPSGMSISMGGGIKVYKLEMGKQAAELFDIFEPVDNADSIVTFEEQKSYYIRWLESLGQ